VNDLHPPRQLADRLADVAGTFHVTGATGWFGRTALELLDHALGRGSTGRVHAYASATRPVKLRTGAVVVARPLVELASAIRPGDVVLHFAFRTREQAAEGIEQYIFDNVAITGHVVAALEGVPCAGLLYASSGAVHDGSGGRVADLAGDPYGTLKHLDELVFTTACAASGARCAIARVFASSGPYMTKPRNYALGDLVLQALAGEPLRIRSAAPVLRSYAAVGDVVAVGLGHLVASEGEPIVAFDATSTAVEVGELAERIRVVLGAEVAIERPERDGSLSNRYVGDPTAFTAMARRHGVTLAGLEEQIERTADWLRP
jgi:nucleoside-diphosphate-sugar epimerase